MFFLVTSISPGSSSRGTFFGENPSLVTFSRCEAVEQVGSTCSNSLLMLRHLWRNWVVLCFNMFWCLSWNLGKMQSMFGLMFVKFSGKKPWTKVCCGQPRRRSLLLVVCVASHFSPELICLNSSCLRFNVEDHLQKIQKSSLRWSNLWSHRNSAVDRWPGSSLPWWNRSGGRS